MINKQEIIYNIVCKVIEHSKSYKESLAHYKKILLDFGTLYQNIPIENVEDLEILYEYFLLPNSIFTFLNSFHYEIENSLIEPIPLLGAKVVQGTGICRHIVQLFLDIAKTCNLEAYTLWIKRTEDHNIGHVLIGLVVAGKRKIYDPTNHKLGKFVKNDSIICKTTETEEKAITYSSDLLTEYKFQNKRNYLAIQKYLEKDLPNSMDFEEYQEKKHKMQELYKEYEKDSLDFKKSHFDVYYDLSKTLQKTCGFY